LWFVISLCYMFSCGFVHWRNLFSKGIGLAFDLCGFGEN
jgi:hypothetical protein